MDCWDGPDGEPVIYHGWTLTSKLLFKDVIEEGIKPFAFSASKYPLILSIENHCSTVQQDKMAEHLNNILGNLLFKEKVDTSLRNLPSPEFFKKKILIKGNLHEKKGPYQIFFLLNNDSEWPEMDFKNNFKKCNIFFSLFLMKASLRLRNGKS